MCSRDPFMYKLIAKEGGKHKSSLEGYKYLMRLHPDEPIPAGWVEVKTINRKSVYQSDGKLLPKYGSLKRWNRK